MTDPSVKDSILDSVKQVLGLGTSDTAFDVDVTMHINSVLVSLQQLGVGPAEGFRVSDRTDVWSDYISGGTLLLENVRSYIAIKVRLIFDPPATSFAIDALQRMAQELEFRINVNAEVLNPPSSPSTTS
jgi:hypothetical protein